MRTVGNSCSPVLPVSEAASWVWRLQPCPLALSPPLFRTEHAEFRGWTGFAGVCGSVFVGSCAGSRGPGSASLSAGNGPAPETSVANVAAHQLWFWTTLESVERGICVFLNCLLRPKAAAVEIATPSLSPPCHIIWLFHYLFEKPPAHPHPPTHTQGIDDPKSERNPKSDPSPM